MPLDVLGRTRATLMKATSNSPWPEGLGNLLKLHRAGDSPLQLLDFNEEFLVSVSHQLALITSLPLIKHNRVRGLNVTRKGWQVFSGTEGDTIKLRGRPKALSTKLGGKPSNGQGNDLG